MGKIERLNKKAAAKKNKADEIIKKLEINSGDNILEIGVGGGYYARRFSNIIGEKGMFYGIDAEDEFLDNLAEINEESQYKNIHAIKQGAAIKVKFDLIFTRNVYHHLPEREQYFKQLKSFLREGGRIAIIDYNERFGLFKFGHYTPKVTITYEMTQAGYTLVSDFDILKNQSFLIYKK